VPAVQYLDDGLVVLLAGEVLAVLSDFFRKLGTPKVIMTPVLD